ncbi:hypothetical protein [Paractinoplanes maris]|uniref:hypothetical protein n=1 Tax=Paractinoplanes maris TaxID=1734446 RepID=UPI00202296D6|nr:hypothetical protein [Actinoplanes maris]
MSSDVTALPSLVPGPAISLSGLPAEVNYLPGRDGRRFVQFALNGNTVALTPDLNDVCGHLLTSGLPVTVLGREVGDRYVVADALLEGVL